MTRKKWNKLRRKDDVLYWTLPPWEKLNASQLVTVRRMGAAPFINVSNAAKLITPLLAERVVYTISSFSFHDPNAVPNAQLFSGALRHDWKKGWIGPEQLGSGNYPQNR